MNDLISVIVPVYNVEKYLEECVNSIINQTYSKLEIILVDDGSTDNSGIMCDSFSLIDKRISVIHKQNGGLSSARNVGIKAAHGQYFSFVDSDDFISSEMIMSLYMAIIENDCELACCDYYLFSKKKELRKIENIRNIEILNQKDAIISLLSMNKYRFFAWNKLFSRKLFEDIYFPENRVFEDIWPIYNVFKKVEKVAYFHCCLYFYRYRADSISKHKFLFEKDRDLIYAINQVEEDIKTEYQDLYDYMIIAYVFYYLSYINKAIKADVCVHEDELIIKDYISNNIDVIKKYSDIPFSRRMQVSLYNKSVLLYSLVYKIFGLFVR